MSTPSVQSPPLSGLRVIDAMHPGVIACPPDTDLRTVARMMATYRVHAVLVLEHDPDQSVEGGGLWGVVSDVDLMQAARSADFDGQTARALAATEVPAVNSTDSLEQALRLMTDHDVSHVVVVERRSKRPIGVLSTLDVARELAGLD